MDDCSYCPYNPETKCEDGCRFERIDFIGLNGNDGTHYFVERIAREIAGEKADEVLMGSRVGKKRWELHIDQALRVLDLLEKEDADRI